MGNKKVSINGNTLILNPISNVQLFNHHQDIDIPVPKVPTYWDEYNDVERENPQHPDYYDAINVYNTRCMNYLFDIIIEKYISIEPSCLENEQWKRLFSILKKQPSLQLLNTEANNYIKYYVLKDIMLKGQLANALVLTEQRVLHTFNSIETYRAGINIHEFDLKNTIDTQITSSTVFLGDQQIVSPLDEYKCCIHSNMLWDKWMQCKYSLDEKASTLALFRLDRTIQLHSEDAIQIESERKHK